ncbi:MAG: preprotein translocase subunit SecA [Bacillota bacterium]|nr:MAG: preprotein translocase subunit SecA [Bacillota bacterium]
MLRGLSRLVLGDFNDRELKRISQIVARVNELEPATAALDDAALAAKTAEFKSRLDAGATLDDILPETFAVVRETAKRTVRMRHFDVQLMGGVVLHEGNIAEMKTGEGKTLVATLPLYLNALAGRGAHLVTVNDYLARRDAEWMGPIYRFLGLDVGVIVHGLDFGQRRAAYRADITYGTNNEMGFDYLRDNMVTSLDHVVQRELHYAIVDEVDSILIDEARTPLIISGPSDKPTELYYRYAQVARQLKPERDYTVDEKARSVAPTEEGVARVEKMTGIRNLFADQNMEHSHYLINALKAQALMHRDVDYVVKDGQVIIVDQFTGRLMFGRRYSDGLHQAIEAKEGVKIERESQTLATITIQNYFRMYDKLAGMTGTALTEEEEFRKIYGMDVIVVPTNRVLVRTEYPDVVYTTENAKFGSVVEEIVDCHQRGQPVLVGTISIEKSERLSRMLEKRGIPHQVLNAKHHEKEAQIIAQAGQKGAVTIATNMAGRGTDIVLGEGVADLGGLHIIGTERHEARRIDNQLRGRSGRQGDPGSSRFYVSLQDDLMRLFGSDNVAGLLERLGVDETVAIENNLVTRSIERAQKRVEAHNFDIRKHVLEYDDVINKQREIVYRQRREVLRGEGLREQVMEMLDGLIDSLVDEHCPDALHPEDWDIAGLAEKAAFNFLPPGKVTARELTTAAWGGGEPGQGRRREDARRAIALELKERALAVYERREADLGPDTMRELEKLIMLRVVDTKWMTHLDAMDDLREGVGLRAYGQKDPLTEYKLEAYGMFNQMVEAIREEIVRMVFKVRVERRVETPAERTGLAMKADATGMGLAAGAGRAELAGGGPGMPRASSTGPVTTGPLASPGGAPGGPLAPAQAGGGRARGPVAGSKQARAPVVKGVKVGRNDPCPCGSGRKYKKCCGAQAS